jgi:hypothetical protein
MQRPHPWIAGARDRSGGGLCEGRLAGPSAGLCLTRPRGGWRRLCGQAGAARRRGLAGAARGAPERHSRQRAPPPAGLRAGFPAAPAVAAGRVTAAAGISHGGRQDGRAPAGRPPPAHPVSRGFNSNDHRNWFDPGNDCQKTANMTCGDDGAEPGQRRGVRHPASRAVALAKIPRTPATARPRRRCRPRPPPALAAQAAHLRRRGPAHAAIAAGRGWRSPPARHRGAAPAPSRAPATGSPSALSHESLPGVRVACRVAVCPPGSDAGAGDQTAGRDGAPAAARLAEILRRRICGPMLPTRARLVTLAQIWVAQLRQRRYR